MTKTLTLAELLAWPDDHLVPIAIIRHLVRQLEAAHTAQIDAAISGAIDATATAIELQAGGLDERPVH